MKGTFKKVLAMALAMTMAAGVLTGCGGCAGCCWQGGTRIKQPERFILTPDYPIKDAALPYNLNITTTTKRITKLDILLFHAFAE